MNKLIVYTISFMSLIIIACSSPRDVSNQQLNSDTTNIVVWVWDETFNVKAAKLAAKEYLVDKPTVSITVETREREEIVADIKNILSSKMYDMLPDIIMLEDYDAGKMLTLYEDEFLDLTDFITVDNFSEYKIELCSKNNKVYGIPFDSGTTALFYRIDILQQAGFREEDLQNITWERFIEIGETVYKKTGIPMLTLDPTDFPLVRAIMQSCGTWYYAKDSNTIHISDNEALYAALNIMETLLEKNIGLSANGWNEFISAFQNDEVASIISGAWIISSIKSNTNQNGLWRITSIPTVSTVPDATPYSNLGGSSWYILKKAKNALLAADFLVSSFNQNYDLWDTLVDTIGVIPCLSNPEILHNFTKQDPFFGNQPVTQILTSYANNVPTVNYGSDTYVIEKILQDEFQNALIHGNLQKCLDATQYKAQSLHY